MAPLTIGTPHGPAAAHVHAAQDPRAALVLGHGAGGGVEAPDLRTARDAALSVGVSVVLVEQPYRVAGKRSQPAASTIDGAWTAVLAELSAGELGGLPLLVGGRSAGARVACRTATGVGAVAVLCLAFPLLPPRRRAATTEPASRLPELDAVEVPMLVVQGERDRFGIPPAAPRREVVVVPGDHGLKSDGAAVGAAVRDWLPAVLP